MRGSRWAISRQEGYYSRKVWIDVDACAGYICGRTSLQDKIRRKKVLDTELVARVVHEELPLEAAQGAVSTRYACSSCPRFR